MFVWDGTPDDKDRRLDTLVKEIGKGLDMVEWTHSDGRRGVCLVTETTGNAMATARGVAEGARKATHPLRVICDFGLVFGASLKPDKMLIARLQAADDLPGLPLDQVLATEAFAAQAKFDLGNDVVLAPVGRADVTPAADAVASRLHRQAC